MTASDIIRLLQQVPPRYELVVTQGEVTHRIHDLTFSHHPAQVTLRLVEQHSEEEIKAVADLKAVTASLDKLVTTMSSAAKLPAPAPSRSFAHWWNEEGSAIAPQPSENHSEHVRRLCEIAWSNGEYVAKYPTPEAACLPEPEATIAELNGEVLVDHITEVAPLPEPVVEANAPTIAEQVVAAAKERRTRKPKTAPFGTA